MESLRSINYNLKSDTEANESQNSFSY